MEIPNPANPFTLIGVTQLGHWIPAKAGMTGLRLRAFMLNCVSPIWVQTFAGLCAFYIGSKIDSGGHENRIQRR